MNRHVKVLGIALGFCALLGYLGCTEALAQEKKPADKPAAAQPAKPADPKATDAKAGDKPVAGGQPSAEEMAMMKKWMDAATPGEAHAKLKPLTGKWTYLTKWRMGPDQPWDESNGKAEFKWILGNRILVQEAKNNPDPAKDAMMGGQPFEGFGMTGYDNVSKKYFNTWTDNMGTGIMTSEGTADGSGKVFTYEGEYNCPMKGPGHKAKSIWKIEGDDKLVFQMFDKDDKGKEFQALDVTYTRAK